MVPNNGISLKNGVRIISHPTRTYKLDFEHDRMIQYTDKLAAMEQFVYKVLQTDRYRHEIYDWNYGVELDDLFGKPLVYAKAEIPRRITEALTPDERIVAVEDFIYTTPAGGVGSDRKTTVCVNFTVRTIFGNLYLSKEVMI